MDLSAAVDRARILLARGSVEEAVSALDAILAESPDHLQALLLKGGVLLESREGADALDLYERAASRHPRSAEALNGLARCLHALSRDHDALRAAEHARGLLTEGDNYLQTGPVYLTLVWCLREMRQFREALQMAEEGLARTPDAVLAQWASLVEEELAEAERERC